MAAPIQNLLCQDGKCDWCAAHLPNGRRRGSPQKFCSKTHRHAYDAALRGHSRGLIAVGLLTIETLRAPYASARALLGASCGEAGSSRPECQ
jgi:hypothetical protein